MKRKSKSVVLGGVGALFLVGIGLLVGVVQSDDAVSASLRHSIQESANGYTESLLSRAEAGEIDAFDLAVLHVAARVGISCASFRYPEAAAILRHYVFGDGSDLALSADYFRESPYLKEKVEAVGAGRHGPISLKQAEDWRLSLAFNPYYLDVTETRVRIYHPNIAFAPLGGERVVTRVPIGKLELQVYDNLVALFEPTPFMAAAEWDRPR